MSFLPFHHPHTRRLWIALATMAFSLAVTAPANAGELRVSTVGDHAPDGCTAADCTLREAVLAADADADTDVILLAPRTTYRLALAGAAEQQGRTGDLDLTEPAKVLATGHGRARIDADGIDRAFDLYAPTTLEGLDITGGVALGDDGGQGAAVRVIDGRLALRDSRLAGNRGPSSALELLGEDGATIRDSSISGNIGSGVIDRGGGGVRAAHTRIDSNTATGLQGFGDGSLSVYHGEVSGNGRLGIEEFADGDVAAVDVRIGDNEGAAIAERGDGGLYVRRSRMRDNGAGVDEADDGELSVYRSRLTGSDRAAAVETGAGSISFIKARIAYNGGIGLSEFDDGSIGLEETTLVGSPDAGAVERGDGNVQLTIAKVLDNGGVGVAEGDAGGVGMVRSRISAAEQEGLRVNEGTASLLRSRVVDNGGGITIADGTLQLGRSAVADNSGLGGIAATDSDVSLRQSTVGRNRAGELAGGVSLTGSGTLSASNSTVAENSSDEAGGGIGLDVGTAAALNAVTIAANRSAGGSAGGLHAAPEVAVTIDNSLLVANRSAGEPSDCIGNGLVSDGGNVVSDPRGGRCGDLGGAADVVAEAARIAPLQPNGGPTSTVALRPGSPAIGAAGADAPARDQRNIGRRDPDAGAFEYQRR